MLKGDDYWNRVSFSDETYVHLNMTNAMNRVRRYSSENRFSPAFSSSTVKFPVKVLIWGCFSSSGIGKLHITKESLNSDRYINTLENVLIPSFREAGIENPLLLDDSAPCHKSAKVKQFKSKRNIESLDWPANSPDLNPIENVWSLLKRKISRIPNSNETSLIKTIKKVWNTEIPKDYLKSLINSMPRRIKEVLKAKGYASKY